MEVGAQGNRPSRKVFQITEEGKLELRRGRRSNTRILLEHFLKEFSSIKIKIRIKSYMVLTIYKNLTILNHIV